MIQIYDPGNTNYDQNGNAILMPTVCELEAELNGGWCITLEHPIDPEGRWKHIVEDAVLQCETFLPNPQRFRIYEKQKNMSGVVAFARPIFLDSKDTLILDSRPTEKNGQEALDILLDGTGFQGKSDIAKEASSYIVRKNIPAALLGTDENSFVNRWGGEAIYDNETIIFNKTAGGNYGVKCEFGKNLQGINETVNMDSVITRIVPFSFNGHMLPGKRPWIDSPNIGKYATVHMRLVQFRDIALAEDMEGGYETIEELQAAMMAAVEKMFSEQKVDIPSVNYEVDMVELSKTVEYRDFKMLETVGLGDVVTCHHKGLGIDVSARAIRLVYDCILGTNKEVELGNYKGNYFTDMKNSTEAMQKTLEESMAVLASGKVDAEKIQGILDCTKVQLQAQRSIAQTQEVRALLFEDLDPDSDTYGAMCIGTMGFEIASERTDDGKDWKWKTFGTGKGFFADQITAGILQGVKIIAESGTIGGWDIEGRAIKKDVVDPNDPTIVNRVYFQPPLASGEKTWVLSCQRSTNSGKSFTGRFILFSDGSAKFGNTVINADGSARFGGTTISADGIIEMRPYDDGESPVYLRMLNADGEAYLSPLLFEMKTENGDTIAMASNLFKMQDSFGDKVTMALLNDGTGICLFRLSNEGGYFSFDNPVKITGDLQAIGNILGEILLGTSLDIEGAASIGGKLSVKGAVEGSSYGRFSDYLRVPVIIGRDGSTAVAVQTYYALYVRDYSGQYPQEVIASTFTTSCSEKWKENIEAVDDVRDIIKTSKIYKYTRKSDKENPKTEYGLILERECPEELMNSTKDGVDTFTMMAMLWHDHQRLISENEDMAKRVTALEKAHGIGQEGE